MFTLDLLESSTLWLRQPMNGSGLRKSSDMSVITQYCRQLERVCVVCVCVGTEREGEEEEEEESIDLGR